MNTLPDDVEVDSYGNPTDGSRLIYCCYPDCGCDGERLCMAERGASERAVRFNKEGMYQKPGREGRLAAMVDIIAPSKLDS